MKSMRYRYPKCPLRVPMSYVSAAPAANSRTVASEDPNRSCSSFGCTICPTWQTRNRTQILPSIPIKRAARDSSAPIPPPCRPRPPQPRRSPAPRPCCRGTSIRALAETPHASLWPSRARPFHPRIRAVRPISRAGPGGPSRTWRFAPLLVSMRHRATVLPHQRCTISRRAS